MRVARSDALSLIEPEALDELIRVLEGKSHDLRIDHVIRLEAALGALHDGISLLDVIRETIWQLEASLIVKVLASTQGNVSGAARLLRIDHKTLSRYLYKYGF